MTGMRAEAAVFFSHGKLLVEFYNTAVVRPPMKQFRHAAVRECHHDVSQNSAIQCDAGGLCRGRVMPCCDRLRIPAVALAFLGSLIVPAAAQQQPLRSECLAMASAPPLRHAGQLRRTAARPQEVAITYVGHSTYYIDNARGRADRDRLQRRPPGPGGCRTSSP